MIAKIILCKKRSIPVTIYTKAFLSASRDSWIFHSVLRSLRSFMAADHFTLCDTSMALPRKKKTIASNNAKLPRLSDRCARLILPEKTREMTMLTVILMSVK